MSTIESDCLPTDLGERQAHPFAVGVRMACENEPVFELFDDSLTASLYAVLVSECADDLGVESVTRHVALCEPEWLSTPVTWGWRQVTYFA